MIKTVSSMKEEIRKAVRGGEGEVKFISLFEAGEYRGHTRLMARLVFGPGCSIGLHEHVGEEELYYIIKGRARVIDDGVAKEIGPGDAVLTGNGGSHTIMNAGQEEMEMLAVILTY